jgi:hypothetical protein
MPLVCSTERESPTEPISPGDYLSHLEAWQEVATLSAHYAIERIA